MPLSHLRVAEIGSLPAGAFCARLFADFGADVLKLEPPGGDPGRFAPPLVDVGAGARESGYFGFLNFNKKSAALPTGPDASVRLHRLLAGADVVVDSSEPNDGAMPRLDHAALQRDNPAIVILSMSWFGESGPYRDFKATDAVCRALAGTVELVGPAEGPPRPIPDYQATPVAGLNAFIAGMAALQAARSGGRRLEISVHEANLTIADYNVALAWGIGTKDRRWGVNKFAPNFPLGIYRCKSGWIGVTVVTPVQWKTFCQLLGLDDLIGDARYLVNRDRLRNAVELEQRFAERFLTRTAEEWFAIGLEQRMPFVVVPAMADLLASPEHRRRAVFTRVTHGERHYEVPGSPLRLASTPPKAGGAVPAAGADPLAWNDARDQPAQAQAQPAAPLDRPLNGLRVIDLSMGWAGPHATRHLADLGCDIVKVEACGYPDWWRGVDTRPIVIEQMLYEKSSYFNVLNRNKRGITLDLTTADGVRLVKELVKGADAVIENYSAGVLPKLGLDYDALCKIKPDLIMLSMPAFAADGAWRECRAYGSTLEQASGLPSVTGAPDGPPAMNHIAYGDPIGGLHAAAALLVALHHRRRTGTGNRIDMSQVECMLTMVAPWIAEQSANGALVPRSGARHPGHVPHNCFACREPDTWVFVAAADDTQWRALAETIGRSDLAVDSGLATLAGRRTREDEIEAALAAWARGRSADEAMQDLQRRGVAAGAVRSPLDLLDDPHLTARGFWQWIDRAHVGRHPQPSPAYRENGEPYAITHPAPTLGQHNVDVLCGILGLSDDEIARLTDAGVIGTRAVPPNLRKARAAAG